MSREPRDKLRLWRGSLTLADACVEAISELVELYPNTKNERALAREVMAVLCSEFPETKLGDGPPKGPALTLDGTPIQLSIRMGRSKSDTDVRWSMDAAPGIVGKSITANRKRWAACMRIAHQLERRYKASLTTMNKLVEILAPKASQMGFGCRFPTGGIPRFQFYVGTLGPGGRQRLYEATGVLGVQPFADTLFPLLADTDTIIPAIDMVEGTKARAKLYVFFGSYDIEHLDSFRKVAGEFWPVPDLKAFFDDVYGQTPEVAEMGAGPLLTFHLNAGVVTGVTLDVATSPLDITLTDGLVMSDADIHKRLRATLKKLDVPSAPYTKALKAFAVTKLDDEAGINERFAILRDRDGSAATAYLSPRFFAHRFGFRIGVPTKPTPEPQASKSKSHGKK